VTNRLFYGDNLDVLRESVDTESVDLVYLDPPFNSNRSYNVLFKQRSGDEAQAQIEAFDDTWTWSHEAEQQYLDLVSGGAPTKVADAIEAMRKLLGDNDVLAYLVMMTPRLVELHRVLKPTGSLYLHCDPTASHYLKVMLDAIFGPKQFRNEMVWCYSGGGVPKKDFAKKHDIILRYSKSKDYYFDVDAVRQDYSPEILSRPKSSYAEHSYKSNPGHKTVGWDLNPKGKHPDDWFYIPIINPAAKERLGYPTQKPEALVAKFVLGSSKPGDVVLDPFCGCGTTVSVAEGLGRRWVGIDITYLAVDLITKRLRDTHGDEVMDSVEVHGIPRDLPGARALFEHSPFDFERWAVSLVHGQPNLKQVGDKGVDGVIRFPLDGTGKSIGRALVSVKGGKHVGPAPVRELAGTIETMRAEMGVLITLSEPTRGMVEEARRAGSYSWPWNGQTYPKSQVVTIEELLAGVQPRMPPPLLPYVQAQRQMKPAAEQGGLFDVG
jgi:DNA modification methylase